jgi:hypothetical protein
MDKVAKCGVMDNILSFAAFKNQKALGKSDGAKRSRLVGTCSSCMAANLRSCLHVTAVQSTWHTQGNSTCRPASCCCGAQQRC